MSQWSDLNNNNSFRTALVIEVLLLPTERLVFTCIPEINLCFPPTGIQGGLLGLQPKTEWFQVSVQQS
ncbi:hypothetical protein ACQP3C_28445, partial [Escherichia coli]